MLVRTRPYCLRAQARSWAQHVRANKPGVASHGRVSPTLQPIVIGGACVAIPRILSLATAAPRPPTAPGPRVRLLQVEGSGRLVKDWHSEVRGGRAQGATRCGTSVHDDLTCSRYEMIHLTTLQTGA